MNTRVNILNNNLPELEKFINELKSLKTTNLSFNSSPTKWDKMLRNVVLTNANNCKYINFNNITVSIPFLICRTNLIHSIAKFNPDSNKLTSSVEKIIAQCDSLYANFKETEPKLIAALEQTNKFIKSKLDKESQEHQNASLIENTYEDTIDDLTKSPSTGLQILGTLMKSLAVIMLGASAAMAMTGIGLAPAAGVAAASVGLFSTGSFVSNKAIPDNHELTQEMGNLADMMTANGR